MQRRDTARLTGALALAVSFAPSLLRRRRKEQLIVSAASAALGAVAGAATEVAVMRLASRIEGGEPAARAVLAGTGALATLAELSASPVSGIALAGTVARVGGICALVGAVAPVRDRSAPLEDPRTGGRRAGGRRRGVRRLAPALQARRAGRRVRFEQYPAEGVARGPSAAARAACLRARRSTSRGRASSARRPPVWSGDPIRVFAGVRSAGDDRGALPARGRRA